MDIPSQFAATGHAEVLVVLKPRRRRKAGSSLALDLAATRDMQGEAMLRLSRHFHRFANSRNALFAREMRQAAKRTPAGGAAAADVEHRSAAPFRYFPNLGLALGTVDRKGASALARNTRDVAGVMALPELGLIRPIEEDAALAGPPQGVSWGVARLRVDRLWQKGLTGEGVLIGHLDTGVDDSHPALQGTVDAFAAFDLMGEQLPGASARDSGRHGTHTAGILVGRPHGGLTFGVAPGAKLASAMVIEGGQVTARVIGGMDWCIGQGVKVLNISLGLRGYVPQFVQIMALLRERGVLPVVAVGNEGPQQSRSPGNLPEALSVGAITEADDIWINSSSQEFQRSEDRIKPDVIAPGAPIWSAIPGGALGALSGTSMAAPHVAGLAALLFQKRPDAGIDAVEAAIFRSCKRPAGVSTLRGNRGIPDAEKALNSL